MSRIKLLPKLALAGAAFVVLTAATAAAQSGTAETFPLPGDEVYPEGVAYQPATGDFFVGSTGDGAIFRGNVAEPGTKAEIFSEPGADGRSTAIGMKVDAQGLLFVAGGESGRMFVYDTGTGALVDRLQNNADMTFVNDVALTPDGSAFFTDSMNPELYRVFPDGSGGYELESYLNLEETPAAYVEGFNLNGIAATGDGRFLITVNSTSGRLFRIDTRTKEVVGIDTGGADLTNGDGILLRGRTLYVVRNEQERVVPVEMSADFLRGEAGEGFTNGSLNYPTTIAAYEGGSRLLAVNSQFAARDSGSAPDLPFAVSGIPVPGRATASASASTSVSASSGASAVPVPETGGPPAVAAVLALPALLAAGALVAGRRALRGR